MNKKLVLLLALLGAASSTLPWRHWGGGWRYAPYWGGPYDGYGYSPAVDAIGAVATLGTAAAIASNQPQSDEQARINAVQRQIRNLDKQIERAQKRGQDTSKLEAQRARLQDNL